MSTKVKVTRFECFFTSAKWKREQLAFFYLEFARDGTKQEQAARKELAKLLAQEKNARPVGYRYHQDVEGIGFLWRVETSIVRKYVDWLSLPCTLEEELIRYKRDGILRPAEPIVVNRLDIDDLEKPHLIGLQLASLCEPLRRALDQYIECHWMAREDWARVNTYGSHVTITREMLQGFLDWFSFARPFGDMLDEAKACAERMRQWEAGAEERKRRWQEEDERTYSQYICDK